MLTEHQSEQAAAHATELAQSQRRPNKICFIFASDWRTAQLVANAFSSFVNQVLQPFSAFDQLDFQQSQNKTAPLVMLSHSLNASLG